MVDDEENLIMKASYDLPVELVRELKVFCVRRDVLMRDAVREAIINYLKKHDAN